MFSTTSAIKYSPPIALLIISNILALKDENNFQSCHAVNATVEAAPSPQKKPNEKELPHWFA